MTASNHLFSGLKVVDLASYIAGPAATTILADFGADVIKVEPPGIGDPYRMFYVLPPNPVAENNYSWQLTNRNKRGIALDLKAPDSKEVLERLVRWADVVVVNFPKRVKEGLGLTYEELGKLNERLIYADVTGYGSAGPEADTPGFDITAYWARTGLMQVTRDAGSPPTLPIPGIGDHATATTLYAGIVTALYNRERTGKGSHVTTSLIANGIWAAAAWVEGGLNGGHFYPQHDRKAPPNALLNTYQTADNRWLLLVAAQAKDWEGFVKAMDMPALLSDARFADPKSRAKNASALVDLLDPVFALRPLEAWKATLSQHRVIFGVVQVADEILEDPQLSVNDIVVPLEIPGKPSARTVNSPIRIEGLSKVKPSIAPLLGEHSQQILAELGFGAAESDHLLSSGAVAALSTSQGKS